MSRSREDFKTNTSISPPHYLPIGWGLDIYYFSSPHYRCYIPKLVKIGRVVLEKMLTDDAQRMTLTHSNWSTEWLRWPKHYLVLENYMMILILLKLQSLHPGRQVWMPMVLEKIFKFRQSIFAIISPWKRAWSFIYPRTLCAVFWLELALLFWRK